MLDHFRKYALFDDVAWTDLTAETIEWHLVGAGLEGLIPSLADLAPYAHQTSPTASGHPVVFIRENPLGRSGATLIAPRETAGGLARALEGPAGLRELPAEAFDLLRIRAGTPVSGQDVTPENLPQEVDRNAAAISFTKGCYLGQETVARLDALGHVNKILRRLELDPDAAPAAGVTALSTPDGKPAGRITSAAFCPEEGRWFGLGYVRVAHASPGTEMTYEADRRTGAARVL
jgi:folate-binding protein YgfZ